MNETENLTDDPTKDKRELSVADIIASAAIEIEEEALPEDFRREFQSRDDRSLGERFLLLLASPRALFGALTPTSGWLWPVLFVVLAAFTNAFVTLNFSDLESFFERQQARRAESMSRYQRKKMASMQDSAKRVTEKSALFAIKAQAFVLPVVSSVAGLFWFATLLFLIVIFGDGHRNYALCMTIVAHSGMIQVVEYLARAVVTAATELVVTRSDLSILVPADHSLALHATLYWFNPFTLLFYYYLYRGLVDSAQVKQMRARIGVLTLMLLSYGAAFGVSAAILKFSPAAKG